MFKQSIIVFAVLVVAVLTYNQCVKREAGYAIETVPSGWEKCDTGGLTCCYWINGTVIVFSHGFILGKYNENTHCEYIIDLDPKCDIVFCMEMDFSMNGNDKLQIRTLETSITWSGKKKPFNTRISGNSASVTFTSSADDVPNGSKWAMGIVCVPKGEYKTVCEACDEIADQMKEGPDGDEIIKRLQ